MLLFDLMELFKSPFVQLLLKLKAIDDLDLGNCSSLGFKRLPVSLDNISADFEIS